eukprot:TRINITY_DN13_c0_g1_i2.p2 TRINITY_DN13_c0_g1~~TRINITY_DN13_c0_g1_i2.p2  ORF type:complete len:642 (+),score=257.72 TRINITY_DN13_c0_g1_i2:100-1926(+)
MTTGPASGSLYVGDLTDDVTEAVLFDVFKEVGSIISIRVCRDAVMRKSLGYAYVNFQNPIDAERALETLNYHPIKGRPVRIMWSQRDPSVRKSGAGNIFIKNLDKSIDNKALFDTFSAFGNILSCKVVTDRDGTSRGFGFVHFETDAAASEAIERVNGMLLNGSKVFVGKFIKRLTREGRAAATFTNIYVKELVETMDAQTLRDKFAVHGDVTSTFTKKHPALEKVFGFVNYAEHDQAAKAVAEMHDKEIPGLSAEGRRLYVQRAMKRAEREQELRRKMMAERAKKHFPPGNNLYVKNLADTLTDADLRAQFAPYGSITSCCIMKDKDTRLSRGFGFVCFEKAEAANKALQEMNGKMIDSKPLYVNVAQRREVRRSMLEMQYATRQGGGRPQMGPPSGFPQAAPAYSGFNPMGGYQGGQQYGYGAQPMRGPPPMPGGFRPMMPQAGAGAWGRGGAMPTGMRRTPMSRGGATAGWPSMAGRALPMHAPPPRPGMPMMGFGQPQMMPGMMHGMAPQMPRKPEPAGDSPLTAESLAAMSPDQQKNALGEQLYHKIARLNPDQAAKITGMLLEMDVSETLNLLESPDLLGSKITEALAVLRAHEQQSAAAGR